MSKPNFPKIPEYLKGNEPELIGKEEALALLELNSRNRHLSKPLVDLYASAMTAERWNPTGVITTGIDKDGAEVLLDGQHRLAAVVQSDTIQIFTLIRKAPMHIQDTMDTGRKRTLGDALSLRGEKQSNALAAATAILYRWEHGKRGTSLTEGNFIVQIPELLEFFGQRDAELRDAVTVSRKVMYRVKANGAIVSLAHILFSAIDDEDANDETTGFFPLLISGAGLGIDSPIYAFRETIYRYDRPGVKLAAYVQLALLIKAWNAYRENKPVKLLTWKPGGARPEAFPEPI